MKFVKWEGENAFFKKATIMERIKSSWYWYLHRQPDPKNLIVDFADMEKATAMARERRLKKA